MALEDGSQDGCIFWTDDRGLRWCKDVHGFYGGTAGSLYYVSRFPSASCEGQGEEESVQEVWMPFSADSPETTAEGDEGQGQTEGASLTLAARGGGGYRHNEGEGVGVDGGDGAIYWRDEDGALWCRDRYGVYGGGEGAEYRSEDGGRVWYGDGEEWIEFSEDALEYLATSTASRMRAKAAKAASRSLYAKRSTYSTSAGPHATLKLRPKHEPNTLVGGCGFSDGDEQSEAGGRIEGDGVEGKGREWENERGVLNAMRHESREQLRYRQLYGEGEAGAGLAARVRAEEARLNAAFDAALSVAPAPLWPEMPLRLG